MATTRRRGKRSLEDGMVVAAIQKPEQQPRPKQAPAFGRSWTVVALLILTFLIIMFDYKTTTSLCVEWVREKRPVKPAKPGPFRPGILPATGVTKGVRPIAYHSHNDYLQEHPLFEALHYGCTSVEADVWIFDNADEDGNPITYKDRDGVLTLFVGHKGHELRDDHTLRRLYLTPLFELLERKNFPPSGRSSWPRGVFDEDHAQPLVLLIDFKTRGLSTWRTVWQQLEPLRAEDYLTYFDGEQIHTRAITIVATGEARLAYDSGNNRRDIFVDAPLACLDQPANYKEPSAPPSELQKRQPQAEVPATVSAENPPDIPYDASNSYYASASLRQIAGRLWFLVPTKKQRLKVRSAVQEAHERDLKARIWDTPSWPKWRRNMVWDMLLEEGVDVLNVDDLAAAAQQDYKRNNLDK